MDWLRPVVRFIISALVLMFVGYIIPGFSALTIGSAILAALVIAGIGYLIEVAFGREVSPYAHGIVGFLVSAAVIYVAQFFVPNLSVSIIGALLSALVIGIIDMFIPTKLR
ncbi:MAG: phage holin family protein [Bacillota bacterium]|jgi:putative membrane protein